MFMQLLSFSTIYKLIEDEKGTPDLYSVKGTGPQSVKLTRDNAYGLEPVLHHVSSGFGMTLTDFKLLNTKLGWLIVTQT
jgi:hypothetical protein